MGNKARVYIPEPTGEEFHSDESLVRLVLGPVGSGKSTMCCIEAFTRSLEMPICIDGIRKARWAIIRNTYPQLKSTTIKTWLMWFPTRQWGRLRQDMPMQQVMDFKSDDGVMNHFEFVFLALDGPGDIDKVGSLELTGIYVNELRAIPAEVWDKCLERIGRYPAKMDVSNEELNRCELISIPKYAIADTNYPSEDHWIKKRFFDEIETYSVYKAFEQPPPILEDTEGVLTQNPNAENIDNLNGGFSYYWDIINGSAYDSYKVQVLCKFGSTFEGERVYPEYKENLHRCNYVIMPDRNYELCLGWDFGRTPTCIIAQNIRGQLCILDEIICVENIGLHAFVESLVLPTLRSSKYSGMKTVSICDPAGVRRNDTDENYCIHELNKFGLNASAAITNLTKPRLDAVKKQLTSLVNGVPALLLSVNCITIHQGFVGGYCYKMIRAVNGFKRPAPEPDKGSKFSHPQDALQYIALHYFHAEKKSTTYVPQQLYIDGQYISA